MPNRDTLIGPLLLAAAAAIAIAAYVSRQSSGEPVAAAQSTSGIITAAATAAPAPEKKADGKSAWAVSAPGRVEPKGGEIPLSSLMAGRVADVLVGLNDKVSAGDLMIRLESPEAEARLVAADAEVSVRRHERDQETVTGAARDRRNAVDAAYDAERLFSLNRSELDRWLIARRAGLANDGDVAKARDTVVKAQQAMEATRQAARRALIDTTVAQTRLESALQAARAELAVADGAVERARIRAPKDGTVLQISTKVGETIAPSPENVVAVIGDIGALSVKAEVDGRDVDKAHVGQAAVIRTDAFPGRDFDGKVTSVAKALEPSRLGQGGLRKLADSEVLAITVDLAGQPPLVPGMRVDTFLKAE